MHTHSFGWEYFSNLNPTEKSRDAARFPAIEIGNSENNLWGPVVTEYMDYHQRVINVIIYRDWLILVVRSIDRLEIR